MKLLEASLRFLVLVRAAEEPIYMCMFVGDVQQLLAFPRCRVFDVKGLRRIWNAL